MSSVDRRRAPIYGAPAHLESVFGAPAEQLLAERLLIYALVLALRPERCLEVGGHWGGSTLIIVSALEDAGVGRLVTVDPEPRFDAEMLARLGTRVDVLRAASPAALPAAMAAVGGPFEFALIDGDHSFLGVLQDIEGLLPCLAANAYVLFHDAHYVEVGSAIDEAIRRHPRRLHDCGLLSVEKALDSREVDGHQVAWGGLRLVAHRPGPITPSSGHDPIRALQGEIEALRARLAGIEGSRTWRWANRIAWSPPARLLRAMLRSVR